MIDSKTLLRQFVYAFIMVALVVASFFITGINVYAQEFQTNPGLEKGIVSCSGAMGQDGLPPCNWCTFVQLIGNMVQYSIYLAVMLSALMFAYAGFLFLTNNGNETNITRAWNIFRRSLLGTVAILAAWLIVNAIMTKLAVGLGLGENWNSITGCKDGGAIKEDTGRYAYSPRTDTNRYNDVLEPYAGPGYRPIERSVAPTVTGPITTLTGNSSVSPDAIFTLPEDYTSSGRSVNLFDSPARRVFSDNGLLFNGGCRIRNGVKNQGTCVNGLRVTAVNGVLQMKRECDEFMGRPCKVIITGGTEKYDQKGKRVHAGGVKSHHTGYKVDFRDNLASKDMREYIQKSGKFTCEGGRILGSAQRCVHKVNKNIVCERETNPEHWDCKF